jgi:hypothetical protein
MVLAENAPQIAGRKKDRSRPMATRQGRLLAEMRKGAIHDNMARKPAESRFPCRSIHPAPPGTQDAMFQDVHHHTLAPASVEACIETFEKSLRRCSKSFSLEI